MLDKIPGLVEILGADGVVLDELDVVVLGDVALAVVADPVHHSYPEVLNCPQQVLTLTFYFRESDQSHLVSYEVSPHSARVCQLCLLRVVLVFLKSY